MLIGLIFPVIYLMQLVRKRISINWKRTGIAIGLSLLGMTLTTVIMIIAVDIKASKLMFFIANLIVGFVWGLILSGCYYVYQLLSQKIN